MCLDSDILNSDALRYWTCLPTLRKNLYSELLVTISGKARHQNSERNSRENNRSPLGVVDLSHLFLLLPGAVCSSGFYPSACFWYVVQVILIQLFAIAHDVVNI